MKEELRKLCEDYTSSPESAQGLYDELLVLFSVSNSSYNDEKFIEALFAEYKKSCAATKDVQQYPQWLNDEQLKWVLTVVKNNC